MKDFRGRGRVFLSNGKISKVRLNFVWQRLNSHLEVCSVILILFGRDELSKIQIFHIEICPEKYEIADMIVNDR